MSYFADEFNNILDIIDESNNIIRSTSLDVLLTTNPFVKQIELYHGDSYQRKQNIIYPEGINAGNRFVRPHMSSFWTPDIEYARLFGLYRLIENTSESKFALFAGDGYHIYIKDTELNNIEKLLKNKFIYIYMKIIDKNMITRGHSKYVDEFSIDVPVKPDDCIKLQWKDFKDLFYNCIVVLNNYDEDKLKNLRNDTLLGLQNTRTGLGKDIVYYSMDKQLGVVRQYKKLQKQRK